MAKVFSENGFTGQVWPDDHQPPHIHVLKAGGEAVIALNGGVLRAYGLSDKEVNKAEELVWKHNAAAWKKWKEFHGDD